MGQSPGIGYLAVGIASLCFGSNFVPVKKYETCASDTSEPHGPAPP
jgi:hypothetical protein